MPPRKPGPIAAPRNPPPPIAAPQKPPPIAPPRKPPPIPPPRKPPPIPPPWKPPIPPPRIPPPPRWAEATSGRNAVAITAAAPIRQSLFMEVSLTHVFEMPPGISLKAIDGEPGMNTKGQAHGPARIYASTNDQPDRASRAPAGRCVSADAVVKP